MKKDDLISGSKWHMQKTIDSINSVKGENVIKSVVGMRSKSVQRYRKILILVWKSTSKEIQTDGIFPIQ